MPKTDPLRDRLATLEKLRDQPISDAAVEKLRAALADRNNHLAARAAEIVSELEIESLQNDLASAFERFLVDPIKTDPGCRARSAIAVALCRTGYKGEGLFLKGIRHVQLEPVFGGREDTAARLRAVCAAGLVRAQYAPVMNELADLLADSEPDARIGALRAIASTGQEAGIPLLRYKAHVGDEDPRVSYECFAALLALAPDTSLRLVAAFLDHQDAAVAEAAALALGESRQPEVADILKAWWERTLNPGLRRTALTALAVSRDKEAVEFLLSLAAEAAPATAAEAVQALAMYQGERKLWSRVQEIVRQRGDL